MSEWPELHWFGLKSISPRNVLLVHYREGCSLKVICTPELSANLLSQVTNSS